MKAERQMDKKDSKPTEVQNNQPIELNGQTLGTINGAHVTLKQSNAKQITASTIMMESSGALQVKGQHIEITNSGIGLTQGNIINIQEGATAMVNAQEANLKSNAVVVISQAATMENSRAGLVISREVRANKFHTVILLAGRVSGPVEAVVDRRSIALFGMSAGLGVGIIMALARFLRRK